MPKLIFGIVLLSFCRLVSAQTPVATLFSTEIPSSYDKYTQYELGTEFQTLTNGLITKVRLYSNINEGGNHTIRLWLHSGSTYSLVAGPLTWNIAAGISGWREFTLPSPVVAGANMNYIVSITNSTDLYYAKTENFSPATSNSYVRYLRGIYSTSIGSAPASVYNASCYFRDIVFALPGTGGNLNPGTIGTAQTICYNASPSPLTQITAPSGGSGVYTYQWQRSADNISWTNIAGATLSGYSPPALTASTYFRRIVTCDTYSPVNSAPVLISVSPQLTLAQLHDNITINNNSSTNINVSISGGTSPYAINYSRNGSAQSAINNYLSGTNIPTGILSTGLYTYSLTSVTDAIGCSAQNLGTSIAVTVNGNSGSSYTPVDSLFRTESTSDYDRDALYELGTKFLTLSDGFIIKARLYTHINEGGDHTVRLWLLNGSTYTLAAGPFSWNFSAGMKGWRDYTFPSPIAVTANQNYIISISNGPDKNYMRTLNFQSETAGSYVRYLGGTYSTTLGKVPTSTYSSSCYFRDIVFAVKNGSQGEINNSEKALVIINSSSSYYTDYVKYIKPYLDNFGIPYDECNISTTGLPELTRYAILIFGHKNVYSTSYPIPQLEAAVTNGAGLYSFDPHLFDFASGFNTIVTQRSVNTNQISISNSTHYITRYHAPDIYNPTNNTINLLGNWSLSQKSNLVNGVELARMSSGGQTVSLLQVSNFGKGRIVKWSGYDWVFEEFLGPVYGMDDLIWRGIVWAARKPFVIQGLPPMVTMRIDDAAGGGNNVDNNFEWLNIANEFGFIPWCGIFNKYISEYQISILRDKLDNNLATASPHAFWSNDFIYFNHDYITPFDVSAKTKSGLDFFKNNGLKISKYFVPHYYEISSEALPLIRAAGGEFLAIHMLPDHAYYSSPWLNAGPYRINRNGEDDATRPVYYAANVNLNGIDFFNCTTEIRDDGGYEWYPDNNADSTAARGIRHLRRSFNSMALASLFTHEYYFDNITIESWRETLEIITSSVSEYNPEYKSMDYAIQYIRAKNNIRITNTLETLNSVEISYSGNNDLDTKCYLFTEQNGEILYRFVLLPQINGSNKVIVSK